MADNLKLYVKSMIKDLEHLSNNYIGLSLEKIAFQNLIKLLRDTYTENPKLFNKAQVASIVKANEIYVTKESKYGELPFQEGYYYADWQQEYKVLKINDEYTEIEYFDGRTEVLSGALLNEKKEAFKEMLRERKCDPIVYKLFHNEYNFETIHEKSKKPTRISHCYKCKETVDPSCQVCYLCGWYICKNDQSCGCAFNN